MGFERTGCQRPGGEPPGPRAWGFVSAMACSTSAPERSRPGNQIHGQLGGCHLGFEVGELRVHHRHGVGRGTAAL